MTQMGKGNHDMLNIVIFHTFSDIIYFGLERRWKDSVQKRIQDSFFPFQHIIMTPAVSKKQDSVDEPAPSGRVPTPPEESV